MHGTEKDRKNKVEPLCSLRKLNECVVKSNPNIKHLINFLELCLEERKTAPLNYKNFEDKIDELNGIETFTFSTSEVGKSSTGSYYYSSNRLLFDILEFANRKGSPFDILACATEVLRIFKNDTFEKEKDKVLPCFWRSHHSEKKEIECNIILNQNKWCSRQTFLL